MPLINDKNDKIPLIKMHLFKFIPYSRGCCIGEFSIIAEYKKDLQTCSNQKLHADIKCLHDRVNNDVTQILTIQTCFIFLLPETQFYIQI